MKTNTELKQFINEKMRRSNGHLNPYKSEKWLKEFHPDILDEILRLSSFLPKDTPFSLRIYCIVNDLYEIPKCECGKDVKLYHSGFAKYCSNQCHMSSKDRINKIKKTCIEKYGTDNVSKTIHVKEKIKQSNLKTNESRSKKIREYLSKKYKDHNIYSYQEANLEPLNDIFQSRKYQQFRCINCNHQFSYIPFMQNGLRCPKCFPKKENKIEILLEQHLNKLGLSFIRNDRTQINKELDLFCSEHNFAIEINGMLWHSYGISKYSYLDNLINEDKNKHIKKLNLCKEKNIRLFQFTDIDIYNPKKLEIISSIINVYCNQAQKIYARKCVIKELSQKEHDDFLDENHLMGRCNAKIRFGLFYEDKLVFVMSFSKPRFKSKNEKYDFELIRLCSIKNTVVIGGFSKILKYLIKNKIIFGNIISYVDASFSDGKGFKTNGFKLIRHSNPNYVYYHPSGKIIKRYEAQKHKLLKILNDKFDPNLSEKENMINAGYRIFYDAGNYVMTLKLQ